MQRFVNNWTATLQAPLLALDIEMQLPPALAAKLLLEPGDFVMLHDTAAYYFSTPFVYNSLPAIPVYGISGADDALKIEVMQEGGVLSL